jgi:hypothetical protein
MEILKFLARMDSMVAPSNERAWNAALILPSSKNNTRPAIGDAMEILKRLARMPNIVPE